MKRYNIIVLCGKAGSGKDTILMNVISLRPEWHKIISCTTRPMREGEKNGTNYFFYSNEEFTTKILNDEMLEATIFNEWCYGTSYDGLNTDTINIGIFNPDGIETLRADPQVNLIAVFYVAANPKTRLLRQLNREEDPDIYEILRRFKTDEQDFSDIDNSHWIAIPNETKEDQYLAAQTITSYLENMGNLN